MGVRGIAAFLAVLVPAFASGAAPAGPEEPASGPAPKMVFDYVSHDWGTAFQGSKMSHTFAFRNDGDATLKISRVQSSCGCTVAKDWPKELKPGEKGHVTATVDTHRRHGRSLTMITVFSNDPAQGQVRLKIGGIVQTMINFKPGPAVAFGNVEIGKSVTKGVELYPLAGHTFEIIDVKGRNPNIEITWEKTKSDEGVTGYRLDLTLKETAAAGRIHDQVGVTGTLDGEKQMKQTLSVQGNVKGRIEVVPARVQFSKGGIEEESVTVTLRRADGKRLSIGEARSDRKELKVKVRPGSKADEATLEVTSRFPPAERVSVVTGDIVVETNVARQRELRVQYFVRFPGPTPKDAPKLKK